jgi:hypothetical protein
MEDHDLLSILDKFVVLVGAVVRVSRHKSFSVDNLAIALDTFYQSWIAGLSGYLLQRLTIGILGQGLKLITAGDHDPIQSIIVLSCELFWRGMVEIWEGTEV